MADTPPIIKTYARRHRNVGVLESTPHSITIKLEKRMMPAEYGEASVEMDQVTDYCQDSKKKTCRKTLNFDRQRNECDDNGKDVGCRSYENQVIKDSKSSWPSSNSLLHELKGPNERRPKSREQMKTEDAQSAEEQKEMQKIEKESLRRKIQLFLSAMNDIQGRRKFYPWKGSVLDSVGGAFIAQNVNDVLSSSAFMSLAAKFPGEVHDKAVQIVNRNENKTHEKLESVNWDSIRNAKVKDISEAIKSRGMNRNLAERIKNCVDNLPRNSGRTDMEWIRGVPPHKAKEYLMNIYGLGLKSVECIRLLALRHKAFPIDVNARRVLLRLGWVPFELAQGEEFHVPKKYPKPNDIQKYIWQHLSELEFEVLYELHCHIITFGKIFCTEQNPNCYECPMREGCKYFSSINEPSKHEGSRKKSTMLAERDIEDLGLRIDSETTLKKGKHKAMSKQTRTKKSYAASLRTEHQVYILQDHHEILAELEPRNLEDPCPYLLAVSESPERDEEDVVFGTLLIPVLTATGGRFPLNGTFFQANEVFADDESSEAPVKVPKASLANPGRATLYCGSTLLYICGGMRCDEVKKCLKSGYVCFRGFNRKTREAKPLHPRFHLLAEKQKRSVNK